MPATAHDAAAPAANGHEAAGADQERHLRQSALDSFRIRAVALIRGYRVRGHLIADLDPLGLTRRTSHPDLDPGDLWLYRAPISTGRSSSTTSWASRPRNCARSWPRLRATYCGTVGVEYMHMQEPRGSASGSQARIEVPRNHTEFTPEGKRAILERLTAAEQLERFCDKRYTGTKRFGLDGGEALIPALEQVIKRGGQLGMKELCIGMPHRGRLNVLTNVMGKPFAALFSEFQGTPANPEDVQGSGDVKYHLGTSTDREIGDVRMHLSLTANPSHLEAVNPVVLGKVRAKQRQRADTARDEVVGLLMHGDAAGVRRSQGLVARDLLRSVGAARLPHRRHHPRHRQQPDRLHHQPGQCAFQPLSLGRGEGQSGADLPRQWRRRRGGGACVAHRDGIPPPLQEGRGGRYFLLSPPRP